MASVSSAVTSTVLAYLPSPGTRRLVPRTGADPGLRPVHHRRDHRGRRLGRSPVRRPRRASRARSPTSPCSRCRSASSAGGSTTWQRTGRPTSARAATRVDALKIWQGGLGIWGAIALRRGGRVDRLPPPRDPAAVLRRRRGARHRRRAGDRPARQLVQPGALRRTDHLPWGLEIYERVDPATGVRDSLGGVAVGRRSRSCTPRSSTSCCGTSGWPLSWCGPTAGSGSATGGRSPSTWPVTRPAGSGSS